MNTDQLSEQVLTMLEKSIPERVTRVERLACALLSGCSDPMIKAVLNSDGALAACHASAIAHFVGRLDRELAREIHHPQPV